MNYIVKRIREHLNFSQKELAERLGTSFATINRCENGRNKLSKLAQDNLIKLCKENDVLVFDFILDKIENEAKIIQYALPEDRMILYHGSKSGLVGDIEPSSRSECDFGRGFYMGTIPRQPLTLICSYSKSKFYIVSIPKEFKNSIVFNDDMEWAMFIAFNRAKMEAAKGSAFYKKYESLSNDCDVAVGSIANDRMFKVLDDFFEGTITDVALTSCLSALELGKQYVCLSKKSCEQVKIEKEIELSYLERQVIQEISAQYRQKGISLADEICKKHRREGLYFDEIINEAVSNG